MPINMRGSLLTFVLSLVITAAAMAAERQAVVLLNNGTQLKGEVVSESLDSITLRISNINTKVKRSDIKSVKFLKTAEEEYKERRAKVGNDDVEGRYKIARWLYEEKAYSLSLKELNELVKLAPDEKKIGLLRRVVILKIGENATNNTDTNPTPTPNPNPNPNPGPDPDPVKAGPLPKEMLDDESINKLKVFEIDFKANPKILIPRNVLEDFIKAYAGKEGIPANPNEKRDFLRKKPEEVLQLMFSLRARDFYGKVQVRDDPPAFAGFRQKVHRNVVVNYCAAAKCHGGPNAGPMFLFNRNPNSTTVMYTNFYILNQYKNKVGFMIDRDIPHKSLLLTYAMPANATALPHPKVPGWQPLFKIGEKDRIYQTALEWIPTLYKPVPQYDVEYKIPRLPSLLKKPDETELDGKKPE